MTGARAATSEATGAAGATGGTSDVPGESGSGGCACSIDATANGTSIFVLAAFVALPWRARPAPSARADQTSVNGFGRLSRDASAAGTVKKKMVPRPMMLSTQMRPPCASTIPRATGSPSPTP